MSSSSVSSVSFTPVDYYKALKTNVAWESRDCKLQDFTAYFLIGVTQKLNSYLDWLALGAVDILYKEWKTHKENVEIIKIRANCCRDLTFVKYLLNLRQRERERDRERGEGERKPRFITRNCVDNAFKISNLSTQSFHNFASHQVALLNLRVSLWRYQLDLLIFSWNPNRWNH